MRGVRQEDEVQVQLHKPHEDAWSRALKADQGRPGLTTEEDLSVQYLRPQLRIVEQSDRAHATP